MILLGILLIIIGIFSILEIFANVNLWFHVTAFWPVILIIYGIYKIIKNRKVKASSFLIISLGIIFQLDKLELLTPTLSTIIWSTTLVILGIILVVSSIAKKNSPKKQTNYYSSENFSRNNNDEQSNYYNDVNNSNNKKDYTFTNFRKNSVFTQDLTYEDVQSTDVDEGIFEEIGSNLIDLSYTFSKNNIKIRSSSFSGGDISTSFGQTTLDLSNVYPASSIIELYCNVYVGNLELILPYNWSYEIIEKNSTSYPACNSECTLRIFYKNFLGDISINQ
ncbi:hypothetical protein LJC13_01770 [Peptostreptococcaceae bacterium OttesenSCG-928-C18]|nr:hypothetical protein [Peptostreptococcaceae bacterium OttesenSCG-928-C18]